MLAARPHTPLRLPLLASLLLAVACASAGDRLNEGIELQAQGRYMEAVYRFAEAVEKDPSLVAARDRLLAAGDSALQLAMDDADELERRDNPVAAAESYRQIDRMLARIRSVGQRLEPPADYGTIRRMVFDHAIQWQMDLGDQATSDGRWIDARRAYIGARGDLLPSRAQVEASLECETRLLLRWSEVELADGRPRAAYGIAQEALEVRASPSRDVVLSVRELQEAALEAGTVVVAVPPVTALEGVREFLGPEFEIHLDEDLMRDHWTQPPMFVRVADPLIMRHELRGLLRGVPQSPLIVGRALELVGADLGILIEVSTIEVLEQDIRTRTRETHLTSATRGESRAPQPVEYDVVSGELAYFLRAEVILADASGREVAAFTAEARQKGPFERGSYEGNPDRLDLSEADRNLFDPVALAARRAPIEHALMEQLAVAIAAGTYDLVLSRVY